MTRVIVEFVDKGDVIDVGIFGEEEDEATAVEKRVAEDFERRLRNELSSIEESRK